MKSLIFALALAAAALPNALLAQTKLPVLTHQELMTRLQANRDSLLVVNFWATWCAPCVKELPHFEQLGREYAAKGVKVLLVSNDLQQHIETAVKPFIQRHQLHSEVVVVKQIGNNEMIDNLNAAAKAEWSGSIPATFIVDRQGRFVAFAEEEFTYETLQAFVAPHLASASN